MDGTGRTLLTRAASTTQAGFEPWTSSLCGHVAQGESMAQAILRAARDELDLLVSDPEPVLAKHRSRLVIDEDTIGDQSCPVYRACARRETLPDSKGSRTGAGWRGTRSLHMFFVTRAATANRCATSSPR